MNTRFLFTLIISFWTTILFSQHDHDEEGEHHHHKNEISAAIGIVPLPTENTISAGIHMHYIRGIGEKNRFGIGLGLEYIIDEHKHYTISTVFQYRIYKGLIVAYAPGALILKEPTEYDIYLAHHIELSYEFELKRFHIGPVVEVGIEPLGTHFMGGVHLGVDF